MNIIMSTPKGLHRGRMNGDATPSGYRTSRAKWSAALMRRAAKLLIVYVLLAAFIAIGAGRVRMFPSYRLANSGENTVGIVTKLNPELHNSYTYEYTVNDRRYEKGTIAYPGVRIGDAVPVVYLPADPGVSDVGDVGTIAATFRHELELVAVAATVFPAFIVWRMWRSN